MEAVDDVLRQVFLLLAGMFFVAWAAYGYALHQKSSEGSRVAVANLLIGSGVWMVSHRTGQSSFIVYQVADWSVIGGLVAFWSGIQQITRSKRAWYFTFAPLIVEVVTTVMQVPGPGSYFPRAVAFNFMCAAVGIATFYEVISGNTFKQLNAVKKLALGSPFLAAGVSFLLRGVQILIRAYVSSDLLHDPSGDFALFLLVFIAVLAATNISTLMLLVGKLVADLRELSDRDPLTGVFNRRILDRLFESELNRFKRYGHPVSCIVIDIDHFKRINDTHGHDVGDVALKHICRIFTNGIRPTDAFGRQGGEEFCLLCPNTDLKFAIDIAERLRKVLLSNPVTINERTLELSASVGVATLRADDSIASFIRRADQSVYQAKQLGRNRVCAESA